MILVQAKNITKWFQNNSHKNYALNDVNFEINFGEMLYIIGPSGSGKTTLLSIISGILRPNEGVVLNNGNDIWQFSDDQMSDFRLHKIGFVFQDFHLFPKLTTAENVAIPLILQKKNWDESIIKAKKMLEIVGLEGKESLPVYKMSVGEQQRVTIARAIITEPELLIMDEPTASLDGDTGKKIMSFVRENIFSDKRAILVVTHDNRIYNFATRIICMEDGKIIKIVEKIDETH